MPELLPCAPGSPDWLAARRQGVTATDIVTILGLSSWNSAYSLFWQKMGQIPEPADNDRFRLGRELEEYVALRWREDRGSSTYPGGLYRHDARAWQMATLDRRRPADDPADDEPIELKTWADADKPSWSDGPPPAVRAQVLWQMDVMDVAVGHVGVVFLPSGEFRSYVIAHEDEKTHDELGWPGCPVCVDQDLMRRAGAEFMQRLRLELPAPDPDASAATLAAVKARFAKVPDKQAEIDGEMFEHWITAKQMKDAVENEVRSLEIQLREQAGEASVLTVGGQPVARRITGDAHVKAHTRHSDYLKRIVREPVTGDHTNGIGDSQ